jgi:hypothetical protein
MQRKDGLKGEPRCLPAAARNNTRELEPRILADDDFELHQALQDVAPAAVHRLLELVGNMDADEEIRSEALERLRQIQTSGLFEELPVRLRHQADKLLE